MENFSELKNLHPKKKGGEIDTDEPVGTSSRNSFNISINEETNSKVEGKPLRGEEGRKQEKEETGKAVDTETEGGTDGGKWVDTETEGGKGVDTETEGGKG